MSVVLNEIVMQGKAHYKTHVHAYSGFGRLEDDTKIHYGIITSIEFHHFSDYNYTLGGQTLEDAVLTRLTHLLELESDATKSPHKYVFRSNRIAGPADI